MTERILADRGEGYMKLQLALDKLQMVQFVHGLAAWEVIAHLTFRWEVSLDSARRGYEKFMRKALPRISYFYAEEQNPSRDGYHVHALWADCKSIYRKDVWAAWFERFGRARIEPVRSKDDVSQYCSKYVTKQGAWWNTSLQWHRVQKLRGDSSFSLEREPCPGYAPLAVPPLEFPFAAEVFNLACERASQASEPGVDQVSYEDPHQVSLFRDRGDGIWERCS
jgi:hypothetical protein